MSVFPKKTETKSKLSVGLIPLRSALWVFSESVKETAIHTKSLAKSPCCSHQCKMSWDYSWLNTKKLQGQTKEKKLDPRVTCVFFSPFGYLPTNRSFPQTPVIFHAILVVSFKAPLNTEQINSTCAFVKLWWKLLSQHTHIMQQAIDGGWNGNVSSNCRGH